MVLFFLGSASESNPDRRTLRRRADLDCGRLIPDHSSADRGQAVSSRSPVPFERATSLGGGRNAGSVRPLLRVPDTSIQFHVKQYGMENIGHLLPLLGIAAFFAGLVDAVVGGGGLIQIPTLFAAFPAAMPATLFGTNKLASIVGTASAAVQYGRRVAIPWRVALPGALAALVGSWFGARAVAYLSPEILKPLVFVLLVLVAVYTFVRKDFGVGEDRGQQRPRAVAMVVAIGGVVGFYDGFFGPGTGSFLIFLLIKFLQMDFLRASVTAKILNVATNLAAIAFFAFNVDLLWRVAAVMASCNLAGAVVGSRLALRHGVTFVRKMFLVVVCILIAKMAHDLLVWAS